MLRFGLVGFGAIAENGHLPALLSFPGIEVVAVADLSPVRLQRARELLPDAVLFESPRDLIEQGDISAVDLCTPPSTHVGLIEAACGRGLETIVCEKPFVLNEEDYDRVAASAARSGSRVVSVNNWMHSHLNRRVREVLDAGTIGEVQRIELQTGRPDAAKGNAGWLPQWRTSLTHAGGGIILDHGWHQLYLCMAWAGTWPISVACDARTVDERHAPVEDEAVLDLEFPRSGARIELSWTSKERSNSGAIHGTKGAIEICDDRIVVDSAAGLTELPFGERLTQSSYHPDWFASMLRYTVVDTDRAEADRNFAEAGVLVRTISAAYRSAAQGGMPCLLSTPAGERAG